MSAGQTGERMRGDPGISDLGGPARLLFNLVTTWPRDDAQTTRADTNAAVTGLKSSLRIPRIKRRDPSLVHPPTGLTCGIRVLTVFPSASAGEDGGRARSL
jgi:hypothetical protein